MKNTPTPSLSTVDPLHGKPVNLRQGVDLQVCYHPGIKPALVFLHGGLGNRFNWRCQYEFFFNQEREVLTYDLAGHGQSSSYRRYSIGRHQRDLARLLDRFEITAPVLCCHSYGVPIGLELTKRHEVSGLILVAGGTHDLAPWWEIPLMKFMTWGGRYLYYLPVVQALSERLSSDRHTPVLKRFFAENPTPTCYDAYKSLEIFWNYNFFKVVSPQMPAQLPILVMSGGRDPTFTEEMGDALSAYFSLGQHLHLPQAGHLLMAEYPELVNQAISDFIKSL